MNPEVKKKWVEALRSRKYKQGKYCLRNLHPLNPRKKPCHCCLGVLCDLYGQEKGIDYWDVEDRDTLNPSLPPEEVLEWAGLKPEDGTNSFRLNYKGSSVFVHDLNDGYREDSSEYMKDGSLALSFKQIAKLIEEQL